MPSARTFGAARLDDVARRGARRAHRPARRRANGGFDLHAGYAVGLRQRSPKAPAGTQSDRWPIPKRPNVTFSASPRRPAGPSAADHAAAPPRLAASPHWRTRRLHCTRITLTEGRSGAGAYVAPRAGDVGVHVGTTRVAAATAGPQSTMAAAWCACRVGSCVKDRGAVF